MKMIRGSSWALAAALALCAWALYRDACREAGQAMPVGTLLAMVAGAASLIFVLVGWIL